MIKLTEMVQKYKIYCDMDGVLCDFDRTFLKLVPNGEQYKNGWDYEEKHGKKEFWTVIENAGLKFWSEMPWMSHGKILWDYIKDKDTELLSAPSSSAPHCIPGKKIWVKRELRNSNGKTPMLNLKKASEKFIFADTNHILIDDLDKNIKAWIQHGGIGILHTSAKDTIKRLQKLGI